MRRWLPLQFCGLFLLAACDASIPEGTLAEDRYTNDAVGWSMPLPAGWHVLSRAEVRAMTGKGREMFENAAGEPVVTNETDLLYLRGSEQSAFTSAREEYDPADGPYADLQKTLFDTIEDAYPKSGIPIRVERRRETIDGVDFAMMFVSLRTPDGSVEVAQQFVYNALVGTNSFTASIVAANEAEREAALHAWRASTFDVAKQARQTD